MPNEPSAAPNTLEWPLFPAPLSLHATHTLQVSLHSEGCKIPQGAHIEVRFRQGGELFFWHGQHKALKKLLQDWKVPPWQRDYIPLVYIDGKLAVIVGHAISDHFFATGSNDLYQINSLPL